MKVRTYLPAVWAILLMAALTGCREFFVSSALATAAPVSVSDPEQPQRPPEKAGVVVSVSRDTIALKQDADEFSVRFTGETRIRQAAASGEAPNAQHTQEAAAGVVIYKDENYTITDGEVETSFITLRPYEIVQGLYAAVWLGPDGKAEYVLISVRKRT